MASWRLGSTRAATAPRPRGVRPGEPGSMLWHEAPRLRRLARSLRTASRSFALSSSSSARRRSCLADASAARRAWYSSTASWSPAERLGGQWVDPAFGYALPHAKFVLEIADQLDTVADEL